jgi:5-hydroxyisourate hydrolase
MEALARMGGHDRGGTVSISTVVYDSARGRSAAGIQVGLTRRNSTTWDTQSASTTDADGRLIMPPCPRGAYRLTYDTGRYFAELGQRSFYPSVSIEFSLPDITERCEIVLLITPHSYTTYKSV